VVRLGEDAGKQVEVGSGPVSASGAADEARLRAVRERPADRPRVIDLGQVRGMRGQSRPSGAMEMDDDDVKGKEPLQPDAKDILALIIATFEILGPFLLMLFGAAGLVYLFLKLIAH